MSPSVAMFLLASIPLIAGAGASSTPAFMSLALPKIRSLAGGAHARLPVTGKRFMGETAAQRYAKSRMSAKAEATAEGKEEKKAEKQEGVVLNPDFKFSMEDIVGVCKRRGFVFQSSEIYNGFGGFYDYGPLGVELKANIKRVWWRDMVHRRDDMVGLDSSIIASPQIWQSSGHVDGFSDPMVDCKESKMRYRADQLFYGKVELEEGEVIGYVSVMESGTMQEEADKAADTMKRKAKKQGTLKPVTLAEVAECPLDELENIPSPATGKPGSLTPPRAFNLMFQTQVGAMSDASSTAYLRPETAQGIFVNFKNVQQTARTSLPFGIAQIGKAFRNEITPRNFIFRSREFEQMEIEYFIDDDDETWPKAHKEWIDTCYNWLVDIGLKEDLIDLDVHASDKLAHYARACTDVAFKFPFGRSELLGVAARGDFDLSAHASGSGKKMEYNDVETKRKYVPHVIEPSIGVDRLFLALVCSAYDEDTVGGEVRSVMRFTPAIAPIKCAILPLVKNKPELLAKAKEIYNKLQMRYNVVWDQGGAIGRRYRRMDEVGTPFCVTVDFDTLEDGTVTVRDRDTTEQQRLTIDELYAFLSKEIDGF
mmetsp:Transcript_16385/g.41357  ORF Transcript_16385/g.41357 Transcript_16385/m.41357 type:complete len:594 (-) Transcript_16385:178-1959(-)